MPYLSVQVFRLHANALRLAVVAHVRHVHTQYDAFLMRGTDRQEARGLVAGEIDAVLARWRQPGSHID